MWNTKQGALAALVLAGLGLYSYEMRTSPAPGTVALLPPAGSRSQRSASPSAPGTPPGAPPATAASSEAAPPASPGAASTPAATTATPAPTSASQYRDGTYTGPSTFVYFGNVQVRATIANGKLTSVQVLQYPNAHQYSAYVSQQALPYLQQEAIQAQSAQVNIITGATATSEGFIQSLAQALAKA